MLADVRVLAILVAADIERAKRFYVDKLGLQMADVQGIPPDAALFEGSDGTMLYIYFREGGTTAEHTVAGFMVEDIESTVEALAAAGVEFEEYDMLGLKTDERGIADGGSVKSAWFKDSEGNILAINEML
jgi:catechol 2,3-dioxygenase-like lactoylglutathione lyase family enzyme